MKQEWMNRTVSSMRLEQYVLGELPETEARHVEAFLASDPALRRRLETLKAHDAAFADDFPAGEMLPRIEAAARAGRRRRDAGAVAGVAARALAGARARPMAVGMAMMTLLALAAVTLHLPPNRPQDVPLSDPTGNPAGLDGVRLKGQAPELRLYRSTPQGPERVQPGARAAAGDVFQAEFHPGDFAYGAIASVDGNGSVTLHWPPRADAGTSWSALPGHRLPKAYQLDAAPGFERFHLLLSREPLALASLLPLVAASSRRDESWLAQALPKPVHVVTISLRKGR